MVSPESSCITSLSGNISKSPSISEPSLLLVLPSDPVDEMDDVESFPEMLGLISANTLYKNTKPFKMIVLKLS